MRKSNCIFILWICIFFCVNAQAQKIDISDPFALKLELMQLDFLQPLDSDYKDVMVVRNDLQKYDFAIRSKKEKLELRYIIELAPPNNPMYAVPSVQFSRMLTHLATNDEEALITVHSLSTADLEIFNADWGKVAYFQPKIGFSDKPNCKLLSLYREGKGMVHVLFLFDKPSEAVDNRFYTLRFRDAEEGLK